MDLDFTALNGMAFEEPDTEAKEEAGGAWHRRIDREKEDRAKATQMYKAYQNNIKKAGGIRTEIIKGLNAGGCIWLGAKASRSIEAGAGRSTGKAIPSDTPRASRSEYNRGRAHPYTDSNKSPQRANRGLREGNRSGQAVSKYGKTWSGRNTASLFAFMAWERAT